MVDEVEEVEEVEDTDDSSGGNGSSSGDDDVALEDTVEVPGDLIRDIYDDCQGGSNVG